MEARTMLKRLVLALVIGAAGVAAPWGLDGAGVAAAAGVRNPDGVAVIIGNKDYHHVGEVKYAHRDAEAFRRYVVDVLGFDAENLIDLRDATQSQMVGVFGTPDDHEGQLAFWIDPEGVSDVVVFYSGHGMPGLDEGDPGAYLLPADANPNKPELNGYSVDVLTRNLGKLAARSVAVYLDAWFSGVGGDGEALLKASMILSEATLPEGVGANTTVFTATTGKQLAYWDEGSGHGMFTRHLLNALYGEEDAQAYARWLSRKTGKSYRLLSESEWEYAARAGTSTAAYWGDAPADSCTYENSLDAVTMFQVFQKLNEHFGSLQWIRELEPERWQRWVSNLDEGLQTALGAAYFFLEPEEAMLVSLDLYYQRNPARRPRQKLPSSRHPGMEEFLSATEGSLCLDGHADTSPVGSFSANGFGLHNMLGNVSEWTLDCWNESYRGAPRDGSARESAEFELDAAGIMRPSRKSGDCDWCVFRGGSWGFFSFPSLGSLGMLRSAIRGGFPAGVRSIYPGFRVVRTFTL